MNLTRRGFLSSIVLAYASARTRARKLWSPGAQESFIYSQNMRVPFYDGGNGIDVTPTQVLERRIEDVERKHVNDAIPYLFERDHAFFRTTKTGQRVGGRRWWQGGRTHGVERG